MAWNPFAAPTPPATSATPATPAPTAPAQEPQTVQPPATQQPVAKGVNPNMTDPNNSTMGTNPGAANQLPAEPPKPQTPLEVLEGLWQNKPKTDNTPVDTTLSITPEVLSKVTPELQFAAGVSPEIMQKVQEGDTGAIQSMMEHIAKQAYSTAMQHSLALVNSNLETREGLLPELINKNVRSNLTESAVLGSGIPNTASPTVQRELKRVAGQFREANPSASPEEIARATQAYFTELQTAMSQPPASSGVPVQSAEEWDTWFN